MNSDEVCEYLGINRNHLYQLVHRKQLVWATKHGKKAQFRRDDVEAYKNKK